MATATAMAMQQREGDTALMVWHPRVELELALGTVETVIWRGFLVVIFLLICMFLRTLFVFCLGLDFGVGVHSWV